MNHHEVDLVRRGVTALQARFGQAPPIAVVLGSGLGPLVEALQNRETMSYSALEDDENGGWISPSVQGHSGQLVVGRIENTPCVMLSGRIHLYEGYSATEVVRQVRTLRAWGVQLLVLTSAAGGLYQGAEEGHLVVVRQHLNLQATNPLIGPPSEFLNPKKFLDMTHPYDLTACSLLDEGFIQVGAPRFHGRTLPFGVHAGVLGPVYETSSEVQMLRTLGVDTVSMSLPQETIAFKAMGGRVCAVVMVANAAAGMGKEVLEHEDVLAACEKAGAKLAQVLNFTIPDLARVL